MTARVLVPLADGFEEIEAVSIIDVLRRADIEVTTAAVGNKPEVCGSHGITLLTDSLLDDVLEQDFNLIALPGGMPGAENLANHAGLKARLQRQNREGKAVAAICAAPMVLHNAGLLEGLAVTSYPGFLDADKLDYREQPVVEDQGITTSRGPATALRFALHLVEQLAGADKRRELEDKMLMHQHGAN